MSLNGGANVRNIAERSLNTSKHQDLAKEYAKDLFSALTESFQLQTKLDMNTQENKKKIGEIQFFLSQLLVKGEKVDVAQLKKDLIGKKKNTQDWTNEKYLDEVLVGMKKKAGTEASNWETRYQEETNSLSDTDLHQRLDEMYGSTAELLKTKWTFNTARLSLNALSKIEKNSANQEEAAKSIINYLIGAHGNVLKNNRFVNKWKASLRNSGALWTGLERKNLEKHVSDILTHFEVTDKDKEDGKLTKNGLAKAALHQKLKWAYETYKKSQTLDSGVFDQAWRQAA